MAACPSHLSFWLYLDPPLWLCQVGWFEFEEWYTDYFGAKDAPPLSLEDMMQTFSSLG